jgi:oxygen-independent coproporphyrinogen-3 oxidase
MPKYFKALVREIEECREKARVSSIFIGGGTPSVVDQGYIGEIMEKLSDKFTIAADAEITIESNPGTLNKDKLSAYKSYGINRLSMGLQSTEDRLLKIIGRRHSFKDFLNNYNDAVKCGFTNINTDLMFSLPDQSLNDWDNSLEIITELGLQHISCYSLIIEEGTPFYRLNEEGKLNIPSEELDREMYQHAKEFLHREGYSHYEISNFAKPGYECRHNVLYWKAREYIGFGAGAHSYLNDYRYSNVVGIEDYIRLKSEGNSTIDGKDFISNKESMAEFMILGLRLIGGVDRAEFFDRYEVKVDDVYDDIIERFIRQGLLYSEVNKIALTDKGLDLANVVMEDFL